MVGGIHIYRWIFANLFQSVNRQTIIAWVLGSAAVLKVVLNFPLIQGHSYTGASIATLVTGFIDLALFLIWSSRIGYGISLKNAIGIIIRVLIASAVMGLPVYYFNNFYILALVPLAALLYFGLLCIIGGIDKEDRLLI
jgi:O-antigen/teichoic acid export membrane protein